MKTVYGSRVHQARVLQGWKIKDLAAGLGWSSPRLSRLESSGVHGKTVADDVVERLGATLGYPSAFFSTAPVSTVTDGNLLLRAPKSITKTELEYLAQLVNAAAEVTLDAQREQRFPATPFVQFGRGWPIREVAREAREELGYRPEQPIPSMIRALESVGVAVFMPDAVASERLTALSSRRHLGCSQWVGEFHDQPIVLVRPIDSWERTRWTLAHEWGHLVLHRMHTPENAEEQANEFANETLAPIESLRKELRPPITLKQILAVKQRWGISMGAAIRHLGNNELITPERMEALQTQLYTRHLPDGTSWRTKEPGWDMCPPERPRLVSKRLQQTFHTDSPAQIGALDSVVQPAAVFARLLPPVDVPAAGSAAAPAEPSAPRSRAGREQLADVIPLRRA